MQTTNTTPEIIDDAPDKVKADLRKFNKAEDQVNKALAALSTVKAITDQVALDAALDIISKAKKVDKIIEDKRVSLVKPYNDEVKRINQCAKDLAAKLPPAIKTASDVVLEYNRALEAKRIEARTAARIEQLKGIGLIPCYVGIINKPETDVLKGMIYEPFDLSIELFTIQSAEDAAWPSMVDRLVNLINDKIAEKNKAAEAVADADEFFGEEVEVPVVAQVTAAPVTHVPAFGANKVKGVTKRWTFEVTDPALVPREYLVVDEAKIRTAMNAGVREVAGVRFYQSESLTSR